MQPSDEGKSEEDSGSTAIEFKRIRSGYRRRILERLSDGGATVTEVAEAVDLLLPHASAELKRLRSEGLVASDRPEGERGGRQAMTAAGWHALQSDEMARLAVLRGVTPPEGALGCVLAVDGPRILVALCRRPAGSLILLPDRPLDAPDLFGDTSSGTEGVLEDWVWSEPMERRPRWFDSSQLKPIPPPSGDAKLARLDAWTDVSPAWGLLRLRSMEGSPVVRLSTGGWFGSTPEGAYPLPPMGVPTDGNWVIGALGEGGPEVLPDGAVICVGLDSFSREAVLTASARASLTLALLNEAPSEVMAIPLSVLPFWVERAHPRLSPAQRGRRLESLTAALSQPDDPRARRQVDDATWRSFLRHWGGCDWSHHEDVENRTIDISTLSDIAVNSLIKWVESAHPNLPLNIAMRPGTKVTSPISQMRTLQVLLTDSPPDEPTGMLLQPHPVLSSPWVQLRCANGIRVPLYLSPGRSAPPLAHIEGWSPPESAGEVVASRLSLGGPQDGGVTPAVADSEIALLQAAVLCHPVGDESWANRVESSSPLAAWIGSEPSGRWARWQRLGPALGDDWIGLLDPADVPENEIALAVIEGPVEWRLRATQDIRSRVGESPRLAHRLRRAAESASPSAAAWVASTLLSEVALLAQDQQVDLAQWGVDLLLDYPPARCADAITGLGWLSRQMPALTEQEPNDWRERARSIAFSLPMDHDLHLWALLEDWQSHESRPTSDAARLIVSHLPEEWWAPSAEDLLSILSEEEDGIEFLAATDVAWPALILRPADEEHQVPGGQVNTHGGVRRTLLSRLERLAESADWNQTDLDDSPGAEMILDLALGLRAVRDLQRPKRGRCHAYVGWLAMPRESWPPLNPHQISEGDVRISLRISIGATAYHEGLSQQHLV
jgi:DNA-binding transcriptional ArsR family regulator